ncbi:MAG TPA: hypothetical protein DHV31_03245, partial [Clostridiales bacterium]|nr:hypothetical protein [Clostridiales bacterium]
YATQCGMRNSECGIAEADIKKRGMLFFVILSGTKCSRRIANYCAIALDMRYAQVFLGEGVEGGRYKAR